MDILDKAPSLSQDRMLQVPAAADLSAGKGRIGKAVRLRHVPNAVRRMASANATGASREGAEVR